MLVQQTLFPAILFRNVLYYAEELEAHGSIILKLVEMFGEDEVSNEVEPDACGFYNPETKLFYNWLEGSNINRKENERLHKELDTGSDRVPVPVTEISNWQHKAGVMEW